MVSHVEIGDHSTDRLDHAAELEAQDPPPGSLEAEHETPDKRLRPAHVAVRLVDRRGVDLDEDFIVLGYRPLDLFESQHVRWSVSVVDNCSHRVRFHAIAPAPLRLTVRTTFPVFWCVSTYLVASTTSSSG